MTKPTALIAVLIAVVLVAPAEARIKHSQRHHPAHHPTRHHVRNAAHEEEVFWPPTQTLWSGEEILALALEDAEEYWQGPGSHIAPCGGDVTFEARDAQNLLTHEQAKESGDGSASMWTTWHDEVEGVDWLWREGPQYSAANFTGCVIHYDEERWASNVEMTKLWPSVADAVAHELEHLENRWSVETTMDGGSLPIASVPITAVNYPEWTGHNEPASAERHHPPGALTQQQACTYSKCIELPKHDKRGI